MAQVKYSVNLSAADFTFSFSFKGPSVVIPGPDQNYFQATAGWSGETPQRGTNIPQMMYCENTVPTAEGYRSVAYKFFIEPAVPTQRFVRYFPLFEGTGNSALVGLTADRKLWVLRASTGGEWVETSFVNWVDDPAGAGSGYPVLPAWTEPGQVTTTTYANAFGTICIQGVGILGLNDTVHKWLQFPIEGIDPTLINGVCSSSGYFIAWDDTRVYWSSTEAPYDFTPSLITGAGSAGIDGLKGKIKLCKEIGGGFIIYSDVSIISAAYSSNQAIPWIFDVLAGGAGIRKAEAVSADINSQIHFAWTTGGLMAIELNQVKPMFPQLTDFIASGISDKTTSLTAYPTIDYLDEYKEVYAAVISSRYLCISFGTVSDPLPNEYPIPHLTQSFLYDLQLKRWGKLNVDHVQIFEAPFVAKQPDFFLVSAPYPVHVEDEFTLEAASQDGILLTQPVDGLELAAILTSGQLRDIVQSYSVSFDALTIQAKMENGNLRSIVRSYPVEPDSLDLQASLSSGVLRKIVITYSNWVPDSLDLSSQLTGGTLS